MRLRLITMALIAVAVAIPAAARAPWIGPGDRLLRQDLELLKAYKILDTSISTWPIAWKSVTRAISQIDANDRLYPPHVEAAIARLRQMAPRPADYGRIHGKVSVAGTNEERLVRDFAGGARQEVDATASLSRLGDNSYINFNIGVRNETIDDPDIVNFDGSTAAFTLGNWVIFGGFVDQWYGPGFDSALVLSTNARPAPRIGFQRLDPKEIDLPVLRWLGPLQFSVSVARGDSERNDFDHPVFVFMRLEIEPISRFTIGISRLLQLCGEGRPCDAEIVARSVIAGSDLDNTGAFFEPGNQIGGFDFHYSWTLNGLDFDGYSEVSFEDSSGAVTLGDTSTTVGGHVGGYLEQSQLRWRFRVEATDTFANSFFGLNPGIRTPSSTYSNFIYQDGTQFRDRFFGASVGGDAYLTTLEASVTDKRNWLYFLRYRNGVLNAENDTSLVNLGAIADIPADLVNDPPFPPSTRVSDNRESFQLFEAGAFLPSTPFGQFSLELRYITDSPNTPGFNNGQVQGEVSWSFRF